MRLEGCFEVLGGRATELSFLIPGNPIGKPGGDFRAMLGPFEGIFPMGAIRAIRGLWGYGPC